MSGNILVLGAAGRLGYAAAEAFRMAGWTVTSLVRPGAAHRAPRGTKVVEPIDRLEAIAAARGADVVLHALNPTFKTWRRMALPHGRHADISGQPVQLRRRHAGRNRRDDADAAHDPQGRHPGGD